MKNNSHHRIAIIGAGASGLMATATLLERWIPASDIIFIEKNSRSGVKVALTWWGRCNVTTGITQRKELFSKYIRGADFLKHSFEVFWPRKVYQWFENNWLPLYTQDDNRVFPRSDVWQDVVDIFEAIFRKHSLEKMFSTEVLSVSRKSDIFIIETNNWIFFSDILVITTGGNAYSHTGSSGDGYAFARSLWHDVTPLWPSLNSFEGAEKYCQDISGIAFPNAKLEVTLSSGQKHSIVWPMIFTHFGISWPATFALSAHLAFEKISEENPVIVSVSIDANKDYQKWDSEIQKALEQEPKKLVRSVLSGFLPQRVTDVIMTLSWVDKECVASHFSREQRKQVVHLLTGQLKVTLIRRRPGDEFVTAWWVSLSQVNPKTMESLIIPWLYFGGEVLDIDGVTGGFNLQSAWATGRIIGESI